MPVSATVIVSTLGDHAGVGTGFGNIANLPANRKSTVGQTFVAPAGNNVLDSFTFLIKDGFLNHCVSSPDITLDLKGYVFEWQNAGVTGVPIGTALYESPITTVFTERIGHVDEDPFKGSDSPTEEEKS